MTVWIPSRRHFLKTVGSGAAAATLFPTISFAEELMKTSPVGEGPFYPDHLPLDTDNDLLVINDSITSAVGTVTHLSGRILKQNGQPVRNAFVEIWQVDAQGVYLHSGSADEDRRDQNFQGYGRFLTDHLGRYYFRTVRPVSYPGRTPHIHFGISMNGRRIFTTQMLIKGEPQNQRDGLFRQIKDAKSRQTILAEFKPLPDSKIGEQVATFDIVLGVTPEETEDGKIKGVGKPDRITRRRR